MSGTLSFAPRPAPAPLASMVLAQAGLELRLLVRNGEQVLLTLVIPVLLLVALSTTEVVDVGADGDGRVGAVLAGVAALAVMSTSFTSLAIATGYERRYGVLKRLGATPLPRSGLLAGKALAVAAVEAAQLVVLVAVALLLGWRGGVTAGALAGLPLLVLAATVAFSGLALLMAGTLRAEATLAGANLLYLLLVAAGGVVVPLAEYPEAARGLLALLPLGALTEGLRGTLGGGGFPGVELAVLAGWSVVTVTAASRWFRWE